MATRHPTAWMGEAYRDLVSKDFDWKLRTLQSASAPRCTVDGKKVIMLCSNNYLNLSTHPKLKAAATSVIEEFGVGSGSVRPIAGNMAIHEELERRVARFKRVEASLVYQTGFATNQGLIAQLADKGDIIISDELNHGSIIDGVRLTKAERGVYPHNDMAGLEKLLKESDGTYQKILVISDGVFSMDGDVAPVKEIVELCERFGAMSYIDDAHGEGVLGEGGRGAASHFHVEGRVTVEVGTFSKAFGVVGGYCAGGKDLRSYAYNKSRSWLLSGSHPPMVAAACIAAIDVLETEPQHVERLWENTRYFKEQMQSIGFDIGRSVTPITPAMCGESAKAVALSKALFAAGVFALPIVFPMVARDKARIRNIVTAGLSRADLDEALRAYEDAGRKVKVL